MTIEYEFAKFELLNRDRNVRRNLEKNTRKYCEEMGSYNKVKNIERAILSYIRHQYTNYDECLPLIENEDEYFMLKVMSFANIGSSFDFLSQAAIEKIEYLSKERLNGRAICSKKHFTWWQKIKRVLRVVFRRD